MLQQNSCDTYRHDESNRFDRLNPQDHCVTYDRSNQNGNEKIGHEPYDGYANYSPQQDLAKAHLMNKIEFAIWTDVVLFALRAID